jgi:hypothetical protein
MASSWVVENNAWKYLDFFFLLCSGFRSYATPAATHADKKQGGRGRGRDSKSDMTPWAKSLVAQVISACQW